MISRKFYIIDRVTCKLWATEFNLTRCSGKFYSVVLVGGEPIFSGVSLASSSVSWAYSCCMIRIRLRSVFCFHRIPPGTCLWSTLDSIRPSAYPIFLTLVAMFIFLPVDWRSGRTSGRRRIHSFAGISNGMSPYLGLKYRLNFAMLSNLRVDEARWNSLLIQLWKIWQLSLPTFEIDESHFTHFCISQQSIA